MPPRNPVPPALVGRSRILIRHCTRDYEAEVERERSLPKEKRLVTNIGFSYYSIGWLSGRDIRRGCRQIGKTQERFLVRV